jgi:hypothetical protein
MLSTSVESSSVVLVGIFARRQFCISFFKGAPPPPPPPPDAIIGVLGEDSTETDKPLSIVFSPLSTVFSPLSIVIV